MNLNDIPAGVTIWDLLDEKANKSQLDDKQDVLTVTTVGSSGPSTLVNGTLNIPQYSGGSGGITDLNGETGATQTFATGTSGTDFGISSASNTHTFNIPSASATNRGLLTTTDWSAFNAKQAALTLTTTGTSGAATLVGSTLNIPQYTGNPGTVTSIATSSPITGGTITGSGTIGITQATTSTDGYLSSTDWNTFNSKQAALTNPVTGTGTNNEIAYFNATGSSIGSLTTGTYPSLTELSYVKGVTSAVQTQLNGKQGSLTLTTTGSSGASTLVGNTLNIPQYSGGTDTINWPHTQALSGIGSAIKAEPVYCTLPNLTSTTATIFSQRIVFVGVWIPSAMTITGVKWIQSAAGTFVASNFNGVALYTLSAGTFTRQAVSANDSTIFSTAGTNVMRNKAFTSTYSASAGLHYAALMYSASSGTAPGIFKIPDAVYNSWTLDNTGGTSGFYLSMFATGQTTFPATISPAGLFLQSNIPYLALY